MDTSVIESISKRYHYPEFFCHVQFVRKVALKLQEKYGGEKEVIEISSLLHDIGRDNEKPEENHAEAGVRLARKELKGIGLKREKIQKISGCILAHNCKKKKPKSIEEKIVTTADSASVILYPTAFVILSDKPPRKKARWFLKKVKKDYQLIQFQDYKKELKQKYEELKNNLKMILRD